MRHLEKSDTEKEGAIVHQLLTAGGPRREDETNMIRSNDGASKREWRRARVPETFHLLSAVIVWLVTGTTISSLNKWIFAVYNFRYPLLLSALHMLTAIVVDYGLIKYWFARRRGLDEHGLTSSAKFKVFLLSLTFCASIAFGNVGLNYVQLSFAQMIYTTTPIFTLAISSLVLGKQHHILKYTAMMPICLGASFSIMGEVQFDQTGCLFVFAATMLRGVKSIQQSILLQEEKIHSVFLLYLMAIPSFCILAVAALVLENWAGLQSPVHYDRHLWGFILLSCLGSVLYNLASCCVISLTSAVTLHILGNLNVVGNLLLSQLLFESQLSALSCAGAALTLSGMIIYQNSELIAGFLDARQARSAVASHERKTSTREAEPDSGSTSKTSSHMEPPLIQSLELSSEECHAEEPWAELYNDLEPYLDLEPSLETSPILSPDLEPSPDASPSMYQDLEPSLPILSPDLELSPEASQKLCDNLQLASQSQQPLEKEGRMETEIGDKTASVGPLTQELAAIQDEQVLNDMLDKAVDFEERRMIRAAMRELLKKKREQRDRERAERQQDLRQRGVCAGHNPAGQRSGQKPANGLSSTQQHTHRAAQAKSPNLSSAGSSPKAPTSPACSSAVGVKVHRSSALGGPNTKDVKQMLLDWCRAKTEPYEGVDIQNFSSSWADGLAFCALVHRFFPEGFDYCTLDPYDRRANFEKAFKTAERLADCSPLLDVDDLMRMREPDWKCVYTYIQEFYRCLVEKGLVKTKKKTP
ncbi:hypothetical protein SRHO_G00218410 [Serrasalmus rhombeus]